MQDAATATGLRRLLLPITLLFFATGVVVPMLRRRRLTATTLVLRPAETWAGIDSYLAADHPVVELTPPPAQADTVPMVPAELPAESLTLNTLPRRADSLPRKAGRLSLGLALGIPAGALAGVALMGGLLLAAPGWNQGKDVTIAPEPTLAAQADLPPPSVYAISSVDVSIAPAPDTALLGSILEGDLVHVLSRDLTGAWSAISFPPDTEGFGWVKSAALSGPSGAPATNQALTKLVTLPGGVEALNVPAGTKAANNGDDRLALLAIATALGMTLLPAALSKLSDS